MKKIAFVILNLLFIVQPVRAESVRQRFLRLQVSVESLFPSPSSELENQFFATGQAKWWQTYYGRKGYESESYKGYVRNSDPYHQGLQRISFHLASDCSSFVHRLYQVFGANFPFAKTRNLLALGDFLKSKMSPREYYEMRAQKIRPLDLPYCQWQALAESFRLVEDMSEALTGDLYVYARKKGWRGSYGHVVMVAQPHPFRVIHARNPKLGLVEEDFDYETRPGFLLRWKKPLQPMKISHLNQLTETTYTKEPFVCPPNSADF